MMTTKLFQNRIEFLDTHRGNNNTSNNNNSNNNNTSSNSNSNNNNSNNNNNDDDETISKNYLTLTEVEKSFFDRNFLLYCKDISKSEKEETKICFQLKKKIFFHEEKIWTFLLEPIL